MKFIVTGLALVLLVGMASAGFLHGGWSAPSYRRVVYSSPSYGGWSGGSGWYGGSRGYGGSGGYGGYGRSSGWSSGPIVIRRSGGWGGWNSGWW